MKNLEESNLYKSLNMLEEIVITAEMVEFWRKSNRIDGVYLNQELDNLRNRIKEWRVFCKTPPV